MLLNYQKLSNLQKSIPMKCLINNRPEEYRKLSSNVNEVIMTVLNSLFYFLRKDFARTKSTKKHQKAQRRNQAKAQNAISEQK